MSLTQPSPPHTEILAAAYARLKGSAALAEIVGKSVYNHLPQEEPTPCCRVRWNDTREWDTKDSAGVEGFIVVDVWTDYRGDLLAYQAADIIVALLHLVPLSLPSSQSLILRRETVAMFTEQDGVTHHTAITFSHIATN
jgi:hypothetical protein